jgi:nitroimidazol reductase NimA-like FMN-containing flavoprotein (pyridoxamine 5'-phosphate oxidase superfamily)
MTMRPEFLVLSDEDCRRILRLNHVGRLAFMNGNAVDIEPIGFVASGNWIFFRSAYGAKLESLERNPYAAFEVDQVGGPASWASVVARGTIYMLPADGAPVEQREFARAVAALREAMPGAFTDDDPTPYRNVVYGLHVSELHGRMAQPAGADRGGRPAQPLRAAPAGRRARDGF